MGNIDMSSTIYLEINNVEIKQGDFKGWAGRENSVETNQVGPSGQVDGSPFLVRASGTLSLVEGKKTF